MAGTMIHRILALLVLLGLGLIYGAPAHAVDGLQGADALHALSDIKSDAKPACAHAYEHSHERCRSCGAPVIRRSTGRLRAKAVVTSSKSNNGFLPAIPITRLARSDTLLQRLNGSLSQVSPAGAKIFARTGRLRI